MYRTWVLGGWHDGWRGMLKIVHDCVYDAFTWVGYARSRAARTSSREQPQNADGTTGSVAISDASTTAARADRSGGELGARLTASRRELRPRSRRARRRRRGPDHRRELHGQAGADGPSRRRRRARPPADDLGGGPAESDRGPRRRYRTGPCRRSTASGPRRQRRGRTVLIAQRSARRHPLRGRAPGTRSLIGTACGELPLTRIPYQWRAR